jgi:acyl-coenzyme A thioesterase PaaI-like protein
MCRSPGGLTSETVFSDDFCSYPGVVHGGIVGTAVDDIMANLILLEIGRLTFTTTLRIRFIQPVETAAKYRIVGRITRHMPNSISAEADVLAEDGALSAMATGSYQPIRSAHARTLFGLTKDEHERLKSFLDTDGHARLSEEEHHG